MKNDPLQEIHSLIKTAGEKNYEVLEIQATMGDMLAVTSQNQEGVLFGFPFRIANQIAVICREKKLSPYLCT